MQKKTSAHERQKELFQSGEWATGKKWADDAPKESVDAEAISLMSVGACGAFVHGFEDEFMGNDSCDDVIIQAVCYCLVYTVEPLYKGHPSVVATLSLLQGWPL